MNLLNNALSGSLAAQAALSATSQNIANMSTIGYSRQGALLVTAGATQSGTVSAGNGVVVSSLLRFSDSYTSQQMWRSASSLGQYQTGQPYLTQIEQVMGDDTSNISNGLDDFLSALNAASVDPTSSPLRQQVITSAQSLAQRVNNLNGVMSNQLASMRQQRASTVSQINDLSAGIAALNQKIAASQATQVNASALIDARDRQVDTLAGLVGIQVVNQPGGAINVSLSGGQPLVAGSSAGTLSILGQPDGSQTLSVVFAKETFVLSGNGLSGQLGGLNDYEKNILLPLKQSIADIAGQLSTAVNATLASGFGLSGSAGGPLFVFDAAGVTGMLSIAPGVEAGSLGFSSDPATPGNSDKLLGLIGLWQQPITVSSLGSAPVLLGDANVQLLGQLGTASQRNQASMATAQTVRQQSEATWASVSGVNSDEEAVNLVQYQQMYQANMKVIAVAGSLFDATLAMLA